MITNFGKKLSKDLKDCVASMNRYFRELLWSPGRAEPCGYLSKTIIVLFPQVQK